MANKINIGNQELLVLLEFYDNEYEKIIMCLDENNQKVFIINNKVIMLVKRSLINNDKSHIGYEWQ